MPKGMLADGTPVWKRRQTHGRPYVNAAASFWSRVDIRGRDECWPWEGGKTLQGYGQFHNRNAPRVCLELFGRGAPDGMVVMHSCDNPACVNPKHLSAGTQKDNMRQMMERGRGRGRVSGPMDSAPAFPRKAKPKTKDTDPAPAIAAWGGGRRTVRGGRDLPAAATEQPAEE